MRKVCFNNATSAPARSLRFDPAGFSRGIEAVRRVRRSGRVSMTTRTSSESFNSRRAYSSTIVVSIRWPSRWPREKVAARCSRVCLAWVVRLSLAERCRGKKPTPPGVLPPPPSRSNALGINPRSTGFAPVPTTRRMNAVPHAARVSMEISPHLAIPNVATTHVAMAPVTGKSFAARPIRDRASSRRYTRSAGLPREWNAAPPIRTAVRSTGAAIRFAGVAKTASPIAAHRARFAQGMIRPINAAPTISSVAAPAPAAISAAIQM